MRRLKNIYLIGPMGVGKTTIGRQLAKAIGVAFYDSDKVIEEKTGVDIPTIFEFEGEEGFRKREQAALSQLTQLEGIVLATGGGAILNEQNRSLLKENGFVVYLYCSVEKMLERTRKDTQRPLLQTENPRGKIEDILRQRESYYHSCSDFEIDTGIMKSRLVVNKIINKHRAIIKVENVNNENFTS
ncbi:MAG: shikimate kinase AroK [Gammaproteobacteria bacterium]